MEDPRSDNKLNGDFVIAEYDDKLNNDKWEHIPKAKVQPIKKTKENK